MKYGFKSWRAAIGCASACVIAGLGLCALIGSQARPLEDPWSGWPLVGLALSCLLLVGLGVDIIADKADWAMKQANFERQKKAVGESVRRAALTINTMKRDRASDTIVGGRRGVETLVHADAQRWWEDFSDPALYLHGPPMENGQFSTPEPVKLPVRVCEDKM